MDINLRLKANWIYALASIGAFLSFCPSALGQIEEPLLTKSALVFERSSGSLKLDYAGSLIASGTRSQIVPEFTLQAGLSQRVEGILRFPLLYIQPDIGTPLLAGGQLAAGAKVRVAGDAESPVVVSFQGVVEAPTGNSRIVGDATQLMPQVLADWHVTKHIVSFTNAGWDLSVGGTGNRISLITYESALAFVSGKRVTPAVEFAGSTNAKTGRTQAVLEPDVLFRSTNHVEVKLGFPAGLNARTPALGIHAQLALFW